MNTVVRQLLKPSSPILPIATGIETSGKALSGIKAIIFDIYGTLLVSGSGDVGTAMGSGSDPAFKAAFEKAGFPEKPGDDFSAVRELFFGIIETEHSFLKAKGYPSPEVDIISVWSEILSDQSIRKALPGADTLDAEIIAAAYESTVNPVYPMPGMSGMLDHFSSGPAELGIISNAQFYTPVVFENIRPGGLSAFGFDSELCLFSYMEKRSKPDPFLFTKLLKVLSARGIQPAETVFIGNDMLNDIMPAAQNGIKTVLFAGDKRSLRLREDHDACKTIKPDVIVNRLEDLTEYIQEG